MECQYSMMSYGISPEMLPVNFEGEMNYEFNELQIRRMKRSAAEAASSSAGAGAVTNGARTTSSARANTITEQVLNHDNANHISDGGTSTARTNGNSAVDVIEVATEKDVLLGRGIPMQRHPGNVRLRKLIEDRQDEFWRATKFEKTVIAYDIMKSVQNEWGGRFLERQQPSQSTTSAAAAGGGLGTWKVCSDHVARNKVSYGFRSLRKKKARRLGNTTSTSTSTTSIGS